MVALTAFCTGLVEKIVNRTATTPIWKPVDIMKDFGERPYNPQISLTATGFDVSSRGGSLGGLKVSLRFWKSERYHGSSTSETKRRDKWSSPLGMKLLGCDRS